MIFQSLFLHPLLAQGQPSGGIGAAMLPMVIVVGIFYVLLILPQQRRQKKLQAMLNGLKSGDKVITSSGIYGTVLGLEGDTIQLRIAEQVKIKVSRSAIASLQPEPKES
jgi:preprotein translocase subunit YajC